jgi:glucose/arabinose dehydrogenase
LRIAARTAVSLTALACLSAVLPRGAAATTAIEATAAIPCRAEAPECWPTAFGFTPGGRRVYYVERFSGEVRRRSLDTGHDTKWHTVGNLDDGKASGLLALALDPRWSLGPAFRWVYLFATKADPLRNVVLRVRIAGGDPTVERLTRVPAGKGRNGASLAVGPDGRLYVATGDRQWPELAQDPLSRAGKVLRMKLNGRRPDDNPIPGSKAFSYGHRNSFGIAFDPVTGNLWQTENGPWCEDEVNLITPGSNYGWGPGSECPGTSSEGPGPVIPELEYTPTIAPTGAAFCTGCGLEGVTGGDLLFGAWNDGVVRRVVLDAERDDVAMADAVYDHDRGILAVEAAPDGGLYFSDPTGIFRLHSA